MTLNLYAEPVMTTRGTDLGRHPLKGILCRAFGEHDGSLPEEFVLDPDDLHTLTVLRKVYADQQEVTEGLDTLIEMLRKYRRVRVWTAG